VTGGWQEADDASEVALTGGTMTAGVVRVGDTVRRPVGRWTPAVHSLLRYLEEVGFEGAPRVLGIDEKGREVLTYLPGDPSPSHSDATLVATARLVRRLHDALAGFTPSPDAVWRHPPLGRRAPSPHIGHNDLCAVNTICVDGVPYGFIDWDMAGPGGPLDDLALAAAQYTPIRPDRFWPRPGWPWPMDRPARLRMFCDAYDVEDRIGFLDAIEVFLQESLKETVELGRQRISPYGRFLDGHEDVMRRLELEWLAQNREELERALR